MSPEEALVYRGSTVVAFANATYQWIHVKHFSLSRPDTDPDDVLALVLRHWRFRDNYIWRHETDDGDVHGPFVLTAITQETFRVTAPAAVESTLLAWAEEWAPLDAFTRVQFDAYLYPLIRSATACFELDAPGREHHHDVGYVLGEFREFVLIDRAAETVSLVVGTSD